MGTLTIYFNNNNCIWIQVNGEVYDGEWKDGKKHGYGVWKGTKGQNEFKIYQMFI